MARKILIRIVQIFISIITDITYVGFEKLNFDGPMLYTANHLGRIDAILIIGQKDFGGHPNLIVAIAEKYRDKPFWGWWVKKMDFIILDRFNPDLRALREVLRRLAKDGIMVIAPEGTRSETESLIEGKQGAAYLAAKSGATVVPITLMGTEDRVARQYLKRLKPIPITVTLGDPYQIPALPQKGKDKFLAHWTNEIMCQIAALVDPQYRGIYADNARTLELLNEKELG